ncbi:DsbA family protein [candidate division KSB1 bacterium]
MENIDEHINRDAKKDTNLEKYSVPIAIVIAGALIAGAVIFTNNNSSAGSRTFGNNLSVVAENMRPIDDSDHVWGNKNAKVSIVEYSDFECSFCKKVHPTLAKIVEEFDGEVKWVYRHFPLVSIHTEALPSAVASECVARLAGNVGFWAFISDVFANQQNLSNELYENSASELGISLEEFRECQNDEAVTKRVEDDYQNAIDSGAQGTPYIIVMNKRGEKFPFSGALPYEQIRSIIESAL